MKNSNFWAKISPLLIIVFFAFSCKLLKQQPYENRPDENPDGVTDFFHKQVSEAGFVEVEVISLDTLEAWESEWVFTNPEKTEIPILDKEGDIIMYRTEYTFKTKIQCLGGCKVMKVRASLEDTTAANVLMAAIENAAKAQKAFIVDWSITNATVQVGDFVTCKLIPVSANPTDSEVHYMLITHDQPRQLPAPVKKEPRNPVQKSKPIEKYEP